MIDDSIIGKLHSKSEEKSKEMYLIPTNIAATPAE